MYNDYVDQDMGVLLGKQGIKYECFLIVTGKAGDVTGEKIYWVNENSDIVIDKASLTDKGAEISVSEITGDGAYVYFELTPSKTGYLEYPVTLRDEAGNTIQGEFGFACDISAAKTLSFTGTEETINCTVGEETEVKLTVKGKGLTDDITFSVTSGKADDVEFTPETVKADEVTDGVTVVAAITPSATNFNRYTITATSGTLKKEVELTLYAAAAPYKSIAEAIEANDRGAEHTINGDFVVTHVWDIANGNKAAYVQDATAGFEISGDLGECAVGHHYTTLKGILSKDNNDIYSFGLSEALGTPSVTGKPVEDIPTITFADAAQYQGRLVRFTSIVFDAKGKFSASADAECTISDQEWKQASLKIFPGSDLIGTDVPYDLANPIYMDVVGIVRYIFKMGAWTTIPYISPRSQADLTTAKTLFIDQTNKSAFKDELYLGEEATAEFYITPQGFADTDVITITASSEEDTEATYTLPTNLTIGSLKLQAGQENAPLVKVGIKPAKKSDDTLWGTTYTIKAKAGDVEAIAEVKILVKANGPELTVSTLAAPSGDVYVGQEYEATLFVKGNADVNKTVTFAAPEGSAITSITPATATASKVKTGVEIVVKFKPTAATEGGKNTKTTFPFHATLEGAAEPFATIENVKAHVVAAEPKLTFGSGRITGDIYAGSPVTKEIKVTGNEFITSDITFTPLSDEITITPTTLTAAAVKATGGAKITVTLTAKQASDALQKFEFKATSADGLDATANVSCYVTAPEPKLTIDPPYVFETKTVGDEITTTFTIKGNQFITEDVTFEALNTDIQNFDPATITATEIQGKSVTVTVTIVPSAATEPEKQKSAFTFKAVSGSYSQEGVIEVKVVAKSPTTGLSNTEATARVWSSASTLFVQLSEAANVEVYNIAGQRVMGNRFAAGTSTLNLTQGLYIVKINNTATKVVVE